MWLKLISFHWLYGTASSTFAMMLVPWTKSMTQKLVGRIFVPLQNVSPMEQCLSDKDWFVNVRPSHPVWDLYLWYCDFAPRPLRKCVKAFKLNLQLSNSYLISSTSKHSYPNTHSQSSRFHTDCNLFLNMLALTSFASWAQWAHSVHELAMFLSARLYPSTKKNKLTLQIHT